MAEINSEYDEWCKINGDLLEKWIFYLDSYLHKTLPIKNRKVFHKKIIQAGVPVVADLLIEYIDFLSSNTNAKKINKERLLAARNIYAVASVNFDTKNKKNLRDWHVVFRPIDYTESNISGEGSELIMTIKEEIILSNKISNNQKQYFVGMLDRLIKQKIPLATFGSFIDVIVRVIEILLNDKRPNSQRSVQNNKFNKENSIRYEKANKNKHITASQILKQFRGK